MAKNLLIVESPAKAKTIENILGKDFKVKSSFGHIRDLPVSEIGVDVENNFEPKYIISPDKAKVVKELKSEMKKSQEVWLATDEDREGEAISWHLSEVLGLDSNSVKRITFREITKPAVKKAIENPRTIDLNLVNAQQARRILDRLVGYELSQLLWRKIKGKLSAGRVQSVAVKLIVEREREIRNFVPEMFYKVYGYFLVEDDKNNKVELKAELDHTFKTEKDIESFLENLKTSEFNISDIKVKPIKRNPAPPFTTSTLQQEASRKFGFGVKKTMMVAQKLYEKGLITYMRTDSTNLSNVALGAITEFIKEEYGEKYHQFRRYSSKSANAQEAHEAIRPSYIQKKSVSGIKDEQKLYELIWKRTIASQMASAELERTDVKIGISNNNKMFFVATGQVVKFDGFLKVYMESKDEDDNENTKGILPPVKLGQKLKADKIEALNKFTKPPARYTEATLVKKLETLGIGRPSTYAPTISKIMEKDRGYVVKEKINGTGREVTHLILKDGSIQKKVEKEIFGAVSNRLHPTDMGMVVIDFLEERFKTIMDYGFTADVEKELDEIAEKGLDWRNVIKELYEPFHKEIEDTFANASRVRAKRILGTDPETGHSVLVQITRFGPVVQIGTREEVGEDGKPRFANLQNGMSMETITFDEAMKLFELPKTLGEYKGEEVIIGSGRFGPYVKYNGKFISIPRDKDPLALTMEEAIELIVKKMEEDKPMGEYQGYPITKGKGRFGPFLKWNNLYINVPRKYDLATISMEEAIELIDKKIEKEANRYIKQWEDEKIAIENGRWGPFIRYKKKSVKLPKIDGKKPDEEELKNFTLEQVKEIIEAELPGSFKKKTAKKKPAAKKK
jgi:DNA topoisomerase-1